MHAREIALKLPIQFDADKLQQDLAVAAEFSFKSHPLQYHDGSWKVINLIYAGGNADYKHEGNFGFGTGAPAHTEVLDRCPYFEEVLNAIPGTIKMARLSSLPAGGRIFRHYDPIESVDFDNIRLHIPIRSHHYVTFFLGYQRRRWREGEAWYGDFTFPHSVWNRSSINRVHLIVDVVPDADGLAWFPDGYLSDEAKAIRATARQRSRALSYYHMRVEKLFGWGAERKPVPEAAV